MLENNPEEINQLIRRAKKEEKDAKTATNVVNDAVSHMSPQRQYSKNRSQNKR